jgi:nucleoside-diphosphate-sugar epimerase
MQTVFVTAASGNIGFILIPRLLTHPSIKLILPTSSASKLATYKNNPKITIIEGDLSDPQWVESQLHTHSITTLVLNLWGTNELFTALNLLSATQRVSRIKHLVYLSACGDFLSDPESVLDWMCPQTKIKPPVEMALTRIKSFMHTVIGPSLFFENDLKVKDAIVQGRRWVGPLGKIGASRAAVEDVAAAVERHFWMGGVSGVGGR